MAALAPRRLRSTLPLLEQALTGLVRGQHRRLLAIQLAHIDWLDEQSDVLSAEITRGLTEVRAAEGSPPSSPASVAADGAAEAAASGAPWTLTRARVWLRCPVALDGGLSAGAPHPAAPWRALVPPPAGGRNGPLWRSRTPWSSVPARCWCASNPLRHAGATALLRSSGTSAWLGSPGGARRAAMRSALHRSQPLRHRLFFKGTLERWVEFHL
jgi:hypothetical protein